MSARTRIPSISIIIPVISAILGGFIGSWYGGHLARKQWEFERTLDAYSSFLKIIDETIIVSAGLPSDIYFAKQMKESGRESQAIQLSIKIHDKIQEIPGFVARARRSISTIQSLLPKRELQSQEWFQSFNDLALPLIGYSFQAAEGDTVSLRQTQKLLEILREEVIAYQRQDLNLSIHPALAKKRTSALIPLGVILVLLAVLYIGIFRL